MPRSLSFDTAGALSSVSETGPKDETGADTATSWTFASPEQAAKHLPQFAADMTKAQRDRTAEVARGDA